MLSDTRYGRKDGVMERKGKRRKQLLDDRIAKKVYWKLEKEALDRTL